jgi:hypothetical protein
MHRQLSRRRAARETDIIGGCSRLSPASTGARSGTGSPTSEAGHGSGRTGFGHETRRPRGPGAAGRGRDTSPGAGHPAAPPGPGLGAAAVRLCRGADVHGGGGGGGGGGGDMTSALLCGLDDVMCPPLRCGREQSSGCATSSGDHR